MDIQRIIHRTALPKIDWMMTSWCNYRCEYCIQTNHASSLTPLSEIQEQANKLNKLITENISLYLIGGEVTYYPLVKIFKENLTSDKIKQVHITTNLSRDAEWWEEFTKYIREERGIELQISVSMHITQIKDMDEFIRKAKKYARIVTIVINNDNKDAVAEALEKLKKEGYEGKVTVNVDRNSLETSLSKEVQEIADKYNSGSNFYTVIDKEGNERKMSREEIQFVSDMNFCGYKCSTWVKFKDGKFYRGGCNHKIHELEPIDHITYEPIVCASKKPCPLCTLVELWR